MWVGRAWNTANETSRNKSFAEVNIRAIYTRKNKTRLKYRPWLPLSLKQLCHAAFHLSHRLPFCQALPQLSYQWLVKSPSAMNFRSLPVHGWIKGYPEESASIPFLSVQFVVFLLKTSESINIWYRCSITLLLLISNGESPTLNHSVAIDPALAIYLLQPKSTNQSIDSLIKILAVYTAYAGYRWIKTVQTRNLIVLYSSYRLCGSLRKHPFLLALRRWGRRPQLCALSFSDCYDRVLYGVTSNLPDRTVTKVNSTLRFLPEDLVNVTLGSCFQSWLYCTQTVNTKTLKTNWFS